MIYRLRDGGFEFMDDHNRVGRLRELLREKLGEEIAECFDDVVADMTSDHEEAALEYIQKKLLHPLNIMNSMLADKDFSQTIPDAVKSKLRTIKKELKELDNGSELEKYI
jgi:hypothetical protein